jgi:hypothetical protein
MAVSIFTLTVYEGGNVTTHVINQGSQSADHLIGVTYSNVDNSIIADFNSYGKVKIPFPSTSVRDTFVTALFSGFDTGSSFALDNLGPVATTTTTAAP